MPLEFVQSSKGNNKLLLNNHLFNYRETKNGRAIWRCENYKPIDGKCPAKVITDGIEAHNNVIEVNHCFCY